MAPLIDPGHNLVHRSVGLPRHKVRGNALFASGVDHQPGFLQSIGDGLMHDHMLAPLHGGDADDAVKMVRGHDFDCIHVLFLVQQLAEVRIGRAALEGAARPVGCIVGLDNVFGDVPASGNNTLAPGSPVRLPKRPANRVEKGILCPIPIPYGVLRGIANRNNLDLRDGK